MAPAIDGELVTALAGDYNATHADTSLHSGAVPSGVEVDAYLASLVASVAAGEAPDLVYMSGTAWQPFATQGYFHPLDELAGREKWSVAWPGDEASELQTRLRGKRYLVTFTAQPQVLFLARQAFAEAGLPLPKPDWLYADFQEVARRCTVRSKMTYGYRWSPGYGPNMPWWRMQKHVEWDRLAEPRQARWNAAAVIEAFQFQLFDSQYRLRISPTQAELAAAPAAFDLASGGVAMQVDGPALLQRLDGRRSPARKMTREGTGPDAREAPWSEIGAWLDVQTLPRGRSSGTPHFVPLEGFLMTKASNDKEASWEALKWLAGDAAQQRLVERGQMNHTPEAARRLWLPIARRRWGLANAEAFIRAMEQGTTTMAGELGEASLLRDSGLSGALAAIQHGQATSAREALDAAQPRLQAVLDRYWTRQASIR